MPCTHSTEVKITTFINPHLFWIFEKENLPKRTELEAKLGEVPHTVLRTPQLAQFVLIRNNTCYKRAIIKDISPPETYYCWLVDYGILYSTNKVFKMSNACSQDPPLTKQAALDNVVCVKEVLGPVEKTLVESLHFTPGTVHCADNHIKSATGIFFKCSREINGIHVGAIEVHGRNGDQYDLSTLLVKEKLLTFNTKMFAQALEVNSNADNESYLKFARTVSPFGSSGADGSCKDVSAYSIMTTRSVGRAMSKRSLVQVDILSSPDSATHKQTELQKWVDQINPSTESVVADDPYESDTNSKLETSSQETSKANLDVDNLEPSDSVSVTVKLSPDHLTRLRELKNKHFGGKNTSSSVSSTRLFLDKTSDRVTDTSGSVTSSSVGPPMNQTKFEPELCSSPVASNASASSKGKVLSWGDFEDNASEKSAGPSITRLLNIQPAGASYTSVAKRKPPTPPVVKDKPVSPTVKNNIVVKRNNTVVKASDVEEKDVVEVMHSIDPNIVCLCGPCKKIMSDTAIKYDEGKRVKEPNRKLVKPPLLLKSDDDTDEVVVKSFTAHEKHRLKMLTTSNIVVHGTNCPKPIRSIAEVSFNPGVHHYIRAFDQVYSIQSYAWPCLLRNMNVCVINTPKTGKTMGYLPIMCSYLFEAQERFDDLPTNTISPLVIILCPGTAVADEVYDLIVKMIDDTVKRPAIALAIPPMDKACMNQFQKQCDLLITTPVMLINLLHGRLLTAKRVAHLVLEHADVLVEKFPKEIDTLLTLMNTMLKRRNCNVSVQLTALSERWTIPLESLLKRLHYTPFVCVGAHLEAALYGRADIQMHFLESQAKKLTLCDMLKSNYETCRTVVVCNTDEQVCELRETFEMKGIKGTYITREMERVHVEELEVKWLATRGGKHLVFVCTDVTYNTILSITTAVILIHYSLPATWTQFSARFSCFIENYNSPFNTTKQDDWIRCKAHVFLDETCSKQFPKLIQLLTRMRCTLSTKFHEYYEASIKAKENLHIASKVPLCSKLKQFGKCTNLKCKTRHTLSHDLDYANELPKNGSVKFKILKIRNVTSFTVKLLEHTDLDGNKHNCVKYPNLHKELENFMRQVKHGVYKAQMNVKYVFHCVRDDSYHRCVIKKILRHDRITKTPTTVMIKLIDAGFVMETGVADLYEVPDEFKDIPAQGIEVYVANFAPPDQDDQFSTYSRNKVSALIKAASANGKTYCSGKVLLQLGNTLWIKNMYVMEHLTSLNTSVTRLNLSKDLLKDHLVNKSEAQLTALYKLCDDVGIELPNFSKPKVQDAPYKQVKPQWAFLDESDCIEVYMITVETPKLFFVRIQKFHDLLMELESAIQDELLKPLHRGSVDVHVGQYYLAKDPGSEAFCRAQVVSVSDGNAECFYVDYGDYASVPVSEIKFLSNEFIEKLPFQAIECRLYGVQPLFDRWENEAFDIMQRYIFESETNIFRMLYATTCKTEAPEATGGQKYAILLIDTFSKKHTVINKLLIDCGEAINVEDESIDNEFLQLDTSGSIVQQSEDDEELEEIENRELTFEDVHRLQSKYGSPNNEAPVDSECTENVWDFELNDAEAWIKKFLGLSNTKVQEVNGNNVLPPLRALPSPGYSTPNVEWFQTETHIKLNVLLPNLGEYDLHLLRSASLNFKTTCNDTEYRFHLLLFDKVQMGQQSASGLCLRITLIKSQRSTWPRLTLNKERLRFLKYDYKQIDDPEPPKKPILSLGQVLEDGDGLPGDNIMQYGSDGDSSSDYCSSSDEF